MIESVTVYFSLEGKPLHCLAEGQQGPVDLGRFACGILCPEGWEPRERHRCKVKTLKPLLCEGCQEYVDVVKVVKAKPALGRSTAKRGSRRRGTYRPGRKLPREVE
jgi:hypothetical protein